MNWFKKQWNKFLNDPGFADIIQFVKDDWNRKTEETKKSWKDMGLDKRPF